MMVSILWALATTVFAKVYFKETFATNQVPANWVAPDINKDLGSWKIGSGKFHADPEQSLGLQLTTDAKFYRLSAPFIEEFNTSESPLVVQYSVKFDQGIDCGGGYLKLMSSAFNPRNFSGDSEYSVMFGPDTCGGKSKTQAILNFQGTNHQITDEIRAENDQLTLLLDNKEVSAGSILNAWKLVPSQTIPDPDANKPLDWVDEETIEDPDDSKPTDFDEIPQTLSDPDAEKPEDWQDEDDGVWEAPQIPNPEYTGSYSPKRIPNPLYKGAWMPLQVPNPDYKGDENVGRYSLSYIGFDLWTVKSGTIFDDILITDSIEEAAKFADEIVLKLKAEKPAKAKLDEDERKQAEAEEANHKVEDHEEEDFTEKDEL